MITSSGKACPVPEILTEAAENIFLLSDFGIKVIERLTVKTAIFFRSSTNARKVSETYKILVVFPLNFYEPYECGIFLIDHNTKRKQNLQKILQKLSF